MKTRIFDFLIILLLGLFFQLRILWGGALELGSVSNLWLGLILVSAGFFWICRSAVNKQFEFRRCLWVLVPMALFTAWNAASILWAVDKREALLFTLQWTAHLTVFFLAVHLPDLKGARRFLLISIIAAGLVSCVYSLYQYYVGLDDVRKMIAENSNNIPFSGNARSAFMGRLNSNDVFGTFTFPNPFGCFLALLLPLWLGVFGDLLDAFRKKRGLFTAAAVVGLAGGVLIGYAFYLSGAKGAWMACGVSAALGLLYYILRRKTPAIAAIICAVLVIVSAAGFFLFPEKVSAVREKLHASVKVRVEYWKAGLDMFADHPVRGVGANNFQRYYTQYKTEEGTEVKTPHSAVVSTLSENGIPGVVLLLFFAGAAVFFCRGRDRDPQPPLGEAAGRTLRARKMFAVCSTAILFLFGVILFLILLIAVVMQWLSGNQGAGGVDFGLLAPAFAGIFLLAAAYMRGKRNRKDAEPDFYYHVQWISIFSVLSWFIIFSLPFYSPSLHLPAIYDFPAGHGGFRLPAFGLCGAVMVLTVVFRTDFSDSWKWTGAGLCIGLFAAMIHFLNDMTLRSPGVVASVMGCMGLVFFRKKDVVRRPVSSGVSHGIFFLSLAFFILYYMFFIHEFLGARYVEKGSTFSTRKLYGPSLRCFDRAFSYRYRDSESAYRMAGVYLKMAEATTDPANKRTYFEKAEAWFRKSRTLGNRKAHVNYLIARCVYSIRGTSGRDEVMAELQDAIDLYPLSPDYYFYKGAFHEKYNEPKLAIRFYEKAIQVNSRIIDEMVRLNEDSIQGIQRRISKCKKSPTLNKF